MRMAPRWLMPVPWPKRRACTVKPEAVGVTLHSSLLLPLMLMPSFFSSSLKISKVSVPVFCTPSQVAFTSKFSLVYSLLGSA